MLHQLENEHLIASFKEKGAEMCSLRSKGNGLEYLWQAKPDIWGRHAPVLFPIVGKLQHDKYKLKGQEYLLSQHGFARDLHWIAERETENKLSFYLQESKETLEKYPFSFQLCITYVLEGDSLITTYVVQNNSREVMPFSIGAHPGFACPLQQDEHFEDYYLEFEQAETLERQLLTNGLRNGKTEKVLQDEKELPLSQELFTKDALVFEGLQSGWVAIKSRQGQHGLQVNFEGFPYLGIWTKGGGSPFICIEPWYGVADKEGGAANILQKEGIQHLSSGKEFSCTFSIRLF